MQNGVSFWGDSEGRKDTQVDERKKKIRLNESKKKLLKAWQPAFSLSIIAATLQFYQKVTLYMDWDYRIRDTF